MSKKKGEKKGKECKNDKKEMEEQGKGVGWRQKKLQIEKRRRIDILKQAGRGGGGGVEARRKEKIYTRRKEEVEEVEKSLMKEKKRAILGRKVSRCVCVCVCVCV